MHLASPTLRVVAVASGGTSGTHGKSRREKNAELYNASQLRGKTQWRNNVNNVFRKAMSTVLGVAIHS